MFWYGPVGAFTKNTVRYGAVRYGTERNGTERNGTERYGTERNGTVRDGTIRSPYCIMKYYNTISLNDFKIDLCFYNSVIF